MHKRNNNSQKKVRIIVITILLIVVLLTIGFSAFSTELHLDDLAVKVRIQKDLRITNVSLSNTSNNGSSSWEDYDIDSISSSITLPNSNSTVSFDIEVTNLGNVESGIFNITGLPNNLTYTLSGYTLHDMLCDDTDPTQCILGSVSTFTITIGYAQNGYDANNTNYNINLDFEFGYMVDAVAKAGNQYYDTLQKAIDATPTNTPTTIILLKNTSEIITIDRYQQITFNLQNYTLSNDGNNPVISSNGTLNIYNGTITSNAATNGAINNEQYGTINISGGSVIVTGGRQALYNNKGVATISGNAYLTSSATERAAVQNVSGGTMTITGGTIISTGSYAVNNASTLTLGVKDGNINNSSPVLQSIDDGLYGTGTTRFYDGIIKSLTNPVTNLNLINDTETGYSVVSSTETINNQTYRTAHLGIAVAVNFNPAGGSVSEPIRYVEVNEPVGPLPTPSRTYHIFDGWFTSNGAQISSSTIITEAVTFTAHWTRTPDVAQIGNALYQTLQDAINDVPTDNTPTTINIIQDTSEFVIIPSGTNITFDMDGITMNAISNSPIIENHGNLTITNGTLSTNAAQSAINHVSGTLNISGGRIIATGAKQAVYITGGIVNISGDAYLSSTTNGKPSGSQMERGTVHVVSGTLNVTGGTIIATKQQAISNEGTTTIGVEDGSIDTTTPVLRGDVYGIKSTGTLYFYDGIAMGRTNSIVGTISGQETGSTLITSGTQTISGKTYKTAYLQF